MSLSNNLLISHAVLTTSAFLFFFPLGAILMRLGLPSSILTFRIHVYSQVLALALAISGVSIGIKLANLSGYAIGSNAHTVIGLVVVFSLLVFQPIGGWLQHRHGIKKGGRDVQGTLHIWFGRSMIVLGIVNGGLGLAMAGDTGLDRTTAYIAVAAVVGGLYGLTLVYDVWRSKSVRNIVAFPAKGDDGEKTKGQYTNGNGYA